MEALVRDSFFFRLLSGVFSKISSPAPDKEQNQMAWVQHMNNLRAQAEELETAGLIMRVRQGVGEPNRIYVLIPGKEDAALA